MKSLKKFIPYLIIITVVVGVVFAGSGYRNNSAIQSSSENIPVIILDAGHGGIDGGAVSADGTSEKNLNLDIVLKMQSYFEKLGYKIILTRNEDISIHSSDAQTTREKKVSDLHNRLEIIKSNPDCVFVSVHQNYYTQSKYSGTQVFYSVNNPQSEKLATCIQTSVVASLQPDNTRKIKPSGNSIFLLYPLCLLSVDFFQIPQKPKNLKTKIIVCRWLNTSAKEL